MSIENVVPQTAFWLSWWHMEADGAFEIVSPWWVSGERGDGAMAVCAAVLAVNEEAAKEAVMACHDLRPETLEWRFCEQKAAGWSPFSSRFVQAEWMQWSAPNRPIQHTVTVEQDAETGDLIIPLPDDILLAAGLATGDEIEFEIDNERIIIRRAAAAQATT
jgi:hypothetical protein